MDLDTYSDWADEELQFIGDLIENEGVMDVLKTCLLLGKEEMVAFAQTHSEGVQRFFQTPRPQRAGLLKGIPDTEERHAFLLAVLYEARCASMLLGALCKSGVSAGANPSKAMMIGQAAQAAREVVEQMPSPYPFSEDFAFGMGPGYFSRRPDEAE